MLASGQLRARQHVLALAYDTWLAAFVDVAVGLFVEKPSPVWRVRNSLDSRRMPAAPRSSKGIASEKKLVLGLRVRGGWHGCAVGGFVTVVIKPTFTSRSMPKCGKFGAASTAGWGAGAAIFSPVGRVVLLQKGGSPPQTPPHFLEGVS